MIENVKKVFPYTSVYATTLRQVINTNSHMWGAILLAEDQWHFVEPREISVLDRIGGGDGFVGGLLYAMLKGWDAGKVDSVWLGMRCIGYYISHRLCSTR